MNLEGHSSTLNSDQLSALSSPHFSGSSDVRSSEAVPEPVTPAAGLGGEVRPHKL